MITSISLVILSKKDGDMGHKLLLWPGGGGGGVGCGGCPAP